MGHFMQDCTCECPTLNACKNVMAANMTRAKAAFKKKKGIIVAAIFDTKGSDNESEGSRPGNNNEYVPPFYPPSHLW
jgi:hypothetical protein